MLSLRKIWNEYGIGAIILAFVLLYAINMLYNYISSKGAYGYEMNQNMPSQYGGSSQSMSGGPMTSGSMSELPTAQYGGNNSAVQPANPMGQNEVFSSANGMQTSIPVLPASCSSSTITNPAELLPKDSNNSWAQLNPTGKGELANVNLLRSGYNIGIDTISSSLRNSNQQIRSEPPNPQTPVSIWMQSTITPDFIRPPLEIGSGLQ